MWYLSRTDIDILNKLRPQLARTAVPASRGYVENQVVVKITGCCSGEPLNSSR